MTITAKRRTMIAMRWSAHEIGRERKKKGEEKRKGRERVNDTEKEQKRGNIREIDKERERDR